MPHWLDHYNRRRPHSSLGDRPTHQPRTLGELVDEYLAQHDGAPETIEKLRWLLTKPVKVFGVRRLPQLRSQEIAAADHVRVYPLPAPGDEAQLLQACQELARRRLDPARPLQEL